MNTRGFVVLAAIFSSCATPEEGGYPVAAPTQTPSPLAPVALAASAGEAGLPAPEGAVAPVAPASQAALAASAGEAGLPAPSPLTFRALKSGTKRDLFAVWGSGPEDVYVVGAQGLILQTKDRGETWKVLKSGTKQDLFAVWGSSPEDVYAVGGGTAVDASGVILHTTDGGKSWTLYKSDVGRSLFALWGSGPEQVFAVGALGTILRSTDGGKTWSRGKSTLYTLYSIWGSGADLYAGGASGLILHSDDGGETWKEQHRCKEEPARDPAGGLPCLSGSGMTWAESQRKACYPIRTLFGSEGRVFAGGTENPFEPTPPPPPTLVGDPIPDGGGIFSLRDGGSWTAFSLENITSLWGSGQELYAAGEEGILYSADGGGGWDYLPGEAEALAVWGSSAKDIYLVGWDGAIRHGGE